MINNPKLTLQRLTFPELFSAAGLARLDAFFLETLQEKNTNLFNKLNEYRQAGGKWPDLNVSEFLINLAPYLEDFLAAFFNIEESVAIAKTKTISHNPLGVFKKYYVLRRAKKELNKRDALPPLADLETWLTEELAGNPLQTEDRELAIALLGCHYLDKADHCQEQIEKLVQWCVYHFDDFKVPKRLDYQDLVPTQVTADKYNRLSTTPDELRHRDGFKLTDERFNAREVQDEINYCIYCHDHEGDFCSKGFPVKKGDPDLGFKKNPLEVTLTGCPLEEKISEMHLLKRDGYTIGSLAVVMIDNPMCPATGHRICNECMKACIYQKQDPVNIPQIETRVLTDVLDLPWGVEIYDLLTRWNPLRSTQWIMQPYNGLKVMIAGMGPAGFTLAHHLLLEGFAVVGFDGLKIEPLPQQLLQEPIYAFDNLKEALDERLMAGFGGVAEYGITVRWDKNFLKLIYLSLMRKPTFQVFGGIRFGGTLTVEDAWELGFDHFVVAVGAGLPKALPIAGSLSPGMRQANDFLMALQLGNAIKLSSLTNLQVRLPAVVIGGGLTGVDTATEVQAYYLTQIEKISQRYKILLATIGEEKINQHLDRASREILNEYLRHAEQARKERERATYENQFPDFIKLLREWGGVTIAYRRTMQESPAYINNHEELQKALQEGVFYTECLEPVAANLNEHGHVDTLTCHRRIKTDEQTWVTTKEEIRLPARSILVATGTQPNTAYEFEHRGTFNRLNLQYQHYEDENGELKVAHGVAHCKDEQFGPFTSYRQKDHRVSLVGDTHPVFHGSVVRAIASGLRAYPKILAILKDRLPNKGDFTEYQHFAAKMAHLFSAVLLKVTRKTATVVELTVKAPMAAKHFKPGQFYRLQNYETSAKKINNTLLQMEAIPLAGAACDHQEGILTFIVVENTAAAKICATLETPQPIVLMGPTGVRAKIPKEHETVLIIGNQASLAFTMSYGNELRAAGNRVIYVGYFDSAKEVCYQTELAQATDAIIWLTKTEDPITTIRPQDFSITSENMIDTLIDYAEALSLTDVDRIFLIGNTDLLRTFQAARATTLKEVFIKQPKVFGSVYGNMQCMLKGVCAQCLQWQIDPETGQRTKAVFACSWQDQPLEIIDIDHLDARLTQNHLHEQLNKLWIDYLLLNTPTGI